MFFLMTFMFFFFIGILAMSWYLLKKLEEQTRILSDEHAQLRVLLRAMESRLEKITQLEKLNVMFQGNLETDSTLPGEGKETSAIQDPLMHLSFDNPTISKKDINPGLDLDLQSTPTWNIQIQDQEK